MLNRTVFAKENDTHKDASFLRKAGKVIYRAVVRWNQRFDEFMRQYVPAARPTARFCLPARNYVLAG